MHSKLCATSVGCFFAHGAQKLFTAGAFRNGIVRTIKVYVCVQIHSNIFPAKQNKHERCVNKHRHTLTLSLSHTRRHLAARMYTHGRRNFTAITRRQRRQARQCKQRKTHASNRAFANRERRFFRCTHARARTPRECCERIGGLVLMLIVRKRANERALRFDTVCVCS